MLFCAHKYHFVAVKINNFRFIVCYEDVVRVERIIIDNNIHAPPFRSNERGGREKIKNIFLRRHFCLTLETLSSFRHFIPNGHFQGSDARRIGRTTHKVKMKKEKRTHPRLENGERKTDDEGKEFTRKLTRIVLLLTAVLSQPNGNWIHIKLKTNNADVSAATILHLRLRRWRRVTTNEVGNGIERKEKVLYVQSVHFGFKPSTRNI